MRDLRPCLLLVWAVAIGCETETLPDPPVTPSVAIEDDDKSSSRTAEDVIAEEIAKISGKWTVLAEFFDGRPEKPGRQFRYTFEGDQLTTEVDGKVLGSVKFRLDPTTDPRTLDTMITVDGEEEVTPGIYAIDGDVLRISYTGLGDRPTDFISRDLDEKMVVILQRAED